MAEERFKGGTCIVLGVVCIINAVAILSLLSCIGGVVAGSRYAHQPFCGPGTSREAPCGPDTSPEAPEDFHEIESLFNFYFVGPLSIIGIGLIIRGAIYVRRSRRKA